MPWKDLGLNYHLMQELGLYYINILNNIQYNNYYFILQSWHVNNNDYNIIINYDAVLQGEKLIIVILFKIEK